MLVANGSFSSERELPVKFCDDFNHFKSIIMSPLVHSTTLKCSFMYHIRQLFHMLPKPNLPKSSVRICHLKIIKIYRKLDRKSSFTYAVTLESGE